MTTTADALEVMTIVTACHHRTAPRMDDTEATLATARIWADLFSAYRLEVPDLIKAVKKRALSHAEAPEPAEIIALAREIRRDRAERESETERRAREDRRDAELENRNRLAEIAAGIAESKVIPDA
ncbi:hypothetical protein DSM43518_04805 [Mycobacterium marinum]|uniref:hypothetical protein n=1 Tax=Mycobacterium marinum TaxID=1781 RepID=UPI000DC6D5B7|nr:hypothetical protein [Mycobacterium marinum]AXN51263.1 hypothetical protein CCUG20998_03867 [Mycobacterium marinum]RFZ02818.1 hypothetical protein DSM43518_04805 [Mycobacterium marinum]RFZ26009.1 hypothetical protein DSM43519_01323 [Mycobacterium marinum]RFZ28888.1 hypothetical protein DSM44344_01155 [Mycobacterium marinum]RFZ39074.1 hypothetical protein NCTC2275_00342 [Mycobacterium marinum]